MPVDSQHGYAFMRPLRSKVLLRLEARVERSVGGVEVTSPLTNKACVFFAAAASEKLQHAVQQRPLASCTNSVDFCISLVDAPEIEIEVQGSDVTLFDMCEGSYRKSSRADDIPPRFHEFLVANRSTPERSFNVRSSNKVLEFQECSLCIGSIITVVGELHRNLAGVFSFKPLALDKPRNVKEVEGTTSRRASGSAPGPGPPAPALPGQTGTEAAAEAGGVLVSDHPGLRGAG